MKRCCHCRKLKELSDFYLSKHTPDGFRRACSKCERANAASFHQKYPERAHARYMRTKAEFVSAYGGKCYCCGEDELAFLTLDHVNGGGTVERVREGRGNQMYLKAKREGYPKKYRCACMNCNLATSYGRTCPHQNL